VAALHACILTGWRCACAVDTRLQAQNYLHRGGAGARSRAPALAADGVELCRNVARDLTERLKTVFRRPIDARRRVDSLLRLDYSSQLAALERGCGALQREHARLVKAV
jgi:hypothetical protein